MVTVFGTAISVSIIVVMVGMGYALQGLVVHELNRGDVERQITVSSERVQSIHLDQEMVSKVRSISGVASLEQVANLSAKITYNGITTTVPMYAVTPAYGSAFGIRVDQGEFLKADSDNTDQVVLSSGSLKAIPNLLPEDAVGKQVDIEIRMPAELVSDEGQVTQAVRVTVAGVSNEPDTAISYVPFSLAERFGLRRSSEFMVTATFPEKVTEVRSSIEQLGLSTRNVQDTLQQVDTIFRALRVLIVIMGLITLFVAGLGTFNTISVNLVEQTREIGFLRLVGIRRRDVQALFMIQSVLLAVIGVAAGLLIGLLAGFGVNLMADAFIKTGILQGISLFQVPFLLGFELLAVAVVVGLAVGITPARRAVRINPLRAVQY
jgi:putative ABC transport system permease protein